MKNLFKNKMFGRTLPILSLSLMLVGGFFVHVPLVHAETSVANQAALLAAVADVNETVITLTADITLTSTLVVGRTVTINGAGFTVTRIADNVADIESYAIMVSAGTLTASNLKIVSTNTGTAAQNPSAVGITVQSGASLNLSGSTITAQAVSGLVYGVYAQTGATAVTLNTNTFIFSGVDTTTNAHRIMLGMTGIGTAVSLTGNTIDSNLAAVSQQEIKLAVCADGTDCGGSGSTLAAIKTYAETGNKVAVGEKLRATASDATTRTIYTRTATGWTTPVTTKEGFLLALAGSSDIVLGDNITLTDDLSISRTVTIYGAGFTIDGDGNTITTSGDVTLENMTLVNTENYQADDGNYGIWVASGTLTADNIDMTVVTNAASTADNDGFNVASGASLDLKNSTITLTGATKDQHGVYAQSGAVAVTLTDNTFVFPVRSSSPYSYLVSMQGALVANYPTLTLTGTNTQNAYIKLLLVGDDTLANRERYAAEGNKVAIGERLGVLGIASEAIDGIYVRPATGWNTPVAATAIAGVTPPVAGATPVTTVTAGTGYTGTVTWSGSPSTFANATVYTATITLSATDGYSLIGVTANQFTIDGATATNPADSGVITAVFPITENVKNGGGGGSSYHPPVVPAVPATHLEGCKPGSSDLFDTTSGKSCTVSATPAGPSSSGLSAPQIQGILDVLASFDADAATIANVRAALSGTGGTTTTTTTGSVTSTAVQVFKTNLTMGSLGSEVKALQEFLNSHGYIVSTSGAGSIGHETTFFGRGTSLAVIKYQKAKGITPAVGYFGAITRASINSGQ